MNVLVTTSQSVLLVDCASGDAKVLHRGSGLYYGIACIGAGYAIAARRRLVSSSVPQADEWGCILMFDDHFREQPAIEAPFALRDMHQIAWFDDRLWVTCSFDDSLAVHDGATWKRWIPEVPPQGSGGRPVRDVVNDRYHYNSFFVADDEFALLAHNHGPSDLLFFDRRSRALRRSIPLGHQAHNVWRENDAYATCSSIEGKLVDSNGWELSTGGFPRGAGFDGQRRAIGISALAERGQRDWASAAIAVYDAAWRRLHYVHLLREGMVLDLMPIGAFDVRRQRGALEACSFPLLSKMTEDDLLPGQGSASNTST